MIELVEVKHDMVDPSEYEVADPSERKRRKTASSTRPIGMPVGGTAARSSAQLGSEPAASSNSAGTSLMLAASLPDTIMAPRTTLKTMIDNVDRAAKAVNYAVTISQQARNSFEEEYKRLQATSQDLRELATQGTLFG